MGTFRVPEPSEAAWQVFDDPRLARAGRLRAAYAADVPHIVRAEVGRFAEWWMSPDAFIGEMAHATGPEALARYLAARFGEEPPKEEEMAACQWCGGTKAVPTWPDGEPLPCAKCCPTPSAPADPDRDCICSGRGRDGHNPACPCFVAAPPSEAPAYTGAWPQCGAVHPAEERFCTLGRGHINDHADGVVQWVGARPEAKEQCFAEGPLGHDGCSSMASPLCTKSKYHLGPHQRNEGKPWPNTDCTACACPRHTAERDFLRELAGAVLQNPLDWPRYIRPSAAEKVVRLTEAG